MRTLVPKTGDFALIESLVSDGFGTGYGDGVYCTFDTSDCAGIAVGEEVAVKHKCGWAIGRVHSLTLTENERTEMAIREFRLAPVSPAPDVVISPEEIERVKSEWFRKYAK